jgi:hypothetical protein
MIRVNRHLLDVGIAVQEVGQQVAHRPIEVIDSDPGAAVAHIVSERLPGGQLVVCDITHPDLSEEAPGGRLDLLKSRDFVGPSFPDHGESPGLTPY